MNNLNVVPDRQGIYVLLISVRTSCKITTRGKKLFKLEPGIYTYVGSALCGLRRRIKRYFNLSIGKPHWHIDYLLTCCNTDRLIAICGIVKNQHKLRVNIRLEVLLSSLISAMKISYPISGFGCTDIRGVHSNLYKLHVNSIENAVDYVREIVELIVGRDNTLIVRIR